MADSYNEDMDRWMQETMQKLTYWNYFHVCSAALVYYLVFTWDIKNSSAIWTMVTLVQVFAGSLVQVWSFRMIDSGCCKTTAMHQGFTVAGFKITANMVSQTALLVGCFGGSFFLATHGSYCKLGLGVILGSALALANALRLKYKYVPNTYLEISEWLGTLMLNMGSMSQFVTQAAAAATVMQMAILSKDSSSVYLYPAGILTFFLVLTCVDHLLGVCKWGKDLKQARHDNQQQKQLGIIETASTVFGMNLIRTIAVKLMDHEVHHYMLCSVTGKENLFTRAGEGVVFITLEVLLRFLKFMQIVAKLSASIDTVQILVSEELPCVVPVILFCFGLSGVTTLIDYARYCCDKELKGEMHTSSVMVPLLNSDGQPRSETTQVTRGMTPNNLRFVGGFTLFIITFIASLVVFQTGKLMWILLGVCT